MPIIRLDIGSGPIPREGFLGVDLYVDDPSILKAPMHALPYEDNMVAFLLHKDPLSYQCKDKTKIVSPEVAISL